jgi:hypothetical protein
MNMNNLNIVEIAKKCTYGDCDGCMYKQHDYCYRHLVLDLLSTIIVKNEQISSMKEDYLYLNADFEANKAMLDAAIAGQETLQNALLEMMSNITVYKEEQ